MCGCAKNRAPLFSIVRNMRQVVSQRSARLPLGARRGLKAALPNPVRSNVLRVARQKAALAAVRRRK